MRRLSLLLLLMCSLCVACKREMPAPASIESGSTPAAETKPQGGGEQLPVPIEAIITSYGDECRQIHGTLTGDVRRPEIETVDLDSDGKPDYILNPKNLQCSESASLFCPNEGCDIRIAVSGNGYQNALSVAGGDPKISDGAHGKTVEIEVQRLQCKGASRDVRCVDTISWGSGRVSQKFRIKP